MNELQEISATSLFSTLPKEYPLDLSGRINIEREKLNKILVVLDDDPTGTQTVHGVSVLTEWSVPTIKHEFNNKASVFYILTNSRSMDALQANLLAEEIGKNLIKASEESGQDFMVISRSDSTLRGHYPNEIEALHKALDRNIELTVLIPAFFEGGRYTIHDIHYVKENEKLIPAALTSFARDKAFGFTHSDLKLYIEEKTQGKIKSKEVISFSIQELRTTSPESIAEKLRKVRKGATCIVNAVAYRDLQVFALGLYLSGVNALLRTAASIIPVLAGIQKRPLLIAQDFRLHKSSGILVLVGSYVPKTSMQLENLKSLKNVHHLEVNVSKLLKEPESMCTAMVEELNSNIKQGKDIVLYTSRTLIASDNPSESLQIGNKVSEFMTSLVQGLRHQPKCIIAKGGITSSDTATKGLNVKKAMVLGQVAPGIPVWKLGAESKFPGMNYVVFPGNVGNENLLTEVFLTIRA